MREWPIVLVVALTAGLVGPRIVGPSDRPASETFAYSPPDGFVPAPVASEKVDAVGAQAWELRSDDAARPVVVVHHSAVSMHVDEVSLGKMASEMPEAFEDCTWTHRRHETRVRGDGARVGLIEGDCERGLDLSVAGSAIKVRSRKLQLVFPENEGTSIATISYPTEQAARWEPAFEATIDTAKGVATRVPPPPITHHVAWGGAAALLATLAATLLRRREPRRKKP
jgi:hypothetical protein